MYKENDPTINAELDYWNAKEDPETQDSHCRFYMAALALIISGKKKNINPCWASFIVADMAYLCLQPDDWAAFIASYAKSNMSKKYIRENNAVGANPKKNWAEITDKENMKKLDRKLMDLHSAY